MVLRTLVSDAVVRSPMLVIQQHMEAVVDIVGELALFMEATQDDDWEAARTIQERIASKENDANKVKQQLRRQMSSRLLMPIARSDLLELIAAQDKIGTRSKNIAGLMLGRNMAFPHKLDKQITEFVELAVKSSQVALEAVSATHNLLRSGFAAQETREVERLIAEIERLERRSDKAQAKLRARLYKLEKNMQPVDVMFLYQVMVWLGNISDRAETVAHRLLLISKS